MVVLKNGTILLLEELTKDGDSTVLAMSETDFITWKKDNEGNCFWGRYFRRCAASLELAIADFHARVGG